MSSQLPVPPDSFPPSVTPTGEFAAARPGAYGAPSLVAEGEESGFDWRRYASAIWRYKWLLVLGGAGGAAAGYSATRFEDTVYQASATVWIDEAARPSGGGAGGSRGGGRQGGGRGPIMAEQFVGSTTSWLDLLESNRVLEPVVRQRKLYLRLTVPTDSPAFRRFELAQRSQPGQYRLVVDQSGRSYTLYRGSGIEVERGAVGDSVGRGVGFVWAPPPEVLRPRRELRFQTLITRGAAKQLAAALEGTIPRGGSFIRLTLTGEDAAATAHTLNAVVRQFVDVAAIIKREQLSEVTRQLGQQLAYAETTLRRSEAELQGFRVATITLPQDPGQPLEPGISMTTDPVYQRFFQVKLEREQLRQDRVALERVLARIPETGVAPIEVEGIPAVRQASELQAALEQLRNKERELQILRARYTDDYGPARQLVAEIQTLEREAVPGHIRSLISQIRSREDVLDQQIAQSGRDLQQIPPRAIEEARLRRNVQIGEQLYTNLQGRYEEARLAEYSTTADLQVLDLATVPERPLGGLGALLLLGGLLGGIGLGAGVAVLIEFLDRHVRYPEQVTREMGLPMLGAIPRVTSREDGEEAVQAVESLRSLRLSLIHAYGAAGPLVLTVTSPGQGDGKSFIASNLALSFAEAGHRTLLIDGDIRRGALHRVLNANRKPGLIDYLSGQATREELIQTTSIRSVDFVGCGTRKAAGPELLASSTMSQLLISLRSSYSVILIDSPPLGAGVDPLILGSLTGAVMLVLRTGVTDRDLAEAKLDQLARLPIRVLGAVLNDVRPDGAYRYYAYLSGYEARDEEVVTVPRQLRGVGEPG
jgi:capsular exopolysaccharide synthesis family protein